MTGPIGEQQAERDARLRAALTGKAGTRAIASLVVMAIAVLFPSATTRFLFSVAGGALIVVGLNGAWRTFRSETTDWAELVRDLLVVAAGVVFLVLRARSPDAIISALVLLLAARGLFELLRLLRDGDRRAALWSYFSPAAQLLGAALIWSVPEVLALVGLGFGLFWLVQGLVNLQRAMADPDADPASLAESGTAVYDFLRRRDVGDETRAEVRDGLFFEGAHSIQRVWRFVALMAFATAIATFGVASDSTAVVIGAMLIAPLMTPILGAAASIVSGWTTRFLRSFGLVSLGVVVAIGLSFILSRYVGDFINVATNTQITSRTAPTIIDLAIAVAAGAAGAYANARRDVSDSLPGVAIAVALVPPLAVVGTTLQEGAEGLALGAFLLFATNLVGIIVAASTVFFLLGLTPWNRVEAEADSIFRSFSTAILALALVAIPLTLTGEELLASQSNQAAVERLVSAAVDGTDYDPVTVRLSGGDVEVVLVGPLDAEELGWDVLAADIALQVGREVVVRIRIIPEKEIVLNVEPAPED